MRKLLIKLTIHYGQVYPTALTSRSEVVEIIESFHTIDPGIDLVRLGPEGDGGYLSPNDFTGIEACFSPGVGAISGFEKDYADIGMYVF